MAYPIPYVTSGIYTNILNNANQIQNDFISNPGLVFTRYAPYNPAGELGAENKKNAFNEVIRLSRKIDQQLISALTTRWENQVTRYNAIQREMTSSWRLITGMGKKGILEAGCDFDFHGLPILRGSGLKGLARAKARWAIYEKLGAAAPHSLSELDTKMSDPDDMSFQAWIKMLEGVLPGNQAGKPNQAITNIKAFRKIFGTQNSAGGAVFFDAIPVGTPAFEIDVMTSHFSEYYKDQGVAPRDSLSPIPVYFLTIKEGTRFRFAVGKNRGAPQISDRIRNMAFYWLQTGLNEFGAGAKTAAGYGRFS